MVAERVLDDTDLAAHHLRRDEVVDVDVAAQLDALQVVVGNEGVFLVRRDHHPGGLVDDLPVALVDVAPLRRQADRRRPSHVLQRVVRLVQFEGDHGHAAVEALFTGDDQVGLVAGRLDVHRRDALASDSADHRGPGIAIDRVEIDHHQIAGRASAVPAEQVVARIRSGGDQVASAACHREVVKTQRAGRQLGAAQQQRACIGPVGGRELVRLEAVQPVGVRRGIAIARAQRDIQIVAGQRDRGDRRRRIGARHPQRAEDLQRGGVDRIHAAGAAGHVQAPVVSRERHRVDAPAEQIQRLPELVFGDLGDLHTLLHDHDRVRQQHRRQVVATLDAGQVAFDLGAGCDRGPRRRDRAVRNDPDQLDLAARHRLGGRQQHEHLAVADDGVEVLRAAARTDQARHQFAHRATLLVGRLEVAAVDDDPARIAAVAAGQALQLHAVDLRRRETRHAGQVGELIPDHDGDAGGAAARQRLDALVGASERQAVERERAADPDREQVDTDHRTGQAGGGQGHRGERVDHQQSDRRVDHRAAVGIVDLAHRHRVDAAFRDAAIGRRTGADRAVAADPTGLDRQPAFLLDVVLVQIRSELVEKDPIAGDRAGRCGQRDLCRHFQAAAADIQREGAGHEELAGLRHGQWQVALGHGLDRHRRVLRQRAVADLQHQTVAAVDDAALSGLHDLRAHLGQCFDTHLDVLLQTLPDHADHGRAHAMGQDQAIGSHARHRGVLDEIACAVGGRRLVASGRRVDAHLTLAAVLDQRHRARIDIEAGIERADHQRAEQRIAVDRHRRCGRQPLDRRRNDGGPGAVGMHEAETVDRGHRRVGAGIGEVGA